MVDTVNLGIFSIQPTFFSINGLFGYDNGQIGNVTESAIDRQYQLSGDWL